MQLTKAYYQAKTSVVIDSTTLIKLAQDQFPCVLTGN